MKKRTCRLAAGPSPRTSARHACEQMVHCITLAAQPPRYAGAGGVSITEFGAFFDGRSLRTNSAAKMIPAVARCSEKSRVSGEERMLGLGKKKSGGGGAFAFRVSDVVEV